VIKRIRKKFPQIPIIFYTSFEKDEILDVIMRETNIHYIPKGNKPEILLEFLKKLKAEV